MPETAPGLDLARQVLAQYKATAKTQPAPKKKPTRRRASRMDGRDPVPFGGVLASLNVDYDWRVALDGGSILDRWTTLCPQFADTVQPVSFDAQRGRLDLRPSSHVYATGLSMLGGQLCKQINDKLGREIVRSIRVLRVGPLDAPRPLDAHQDEREQAPEPGPVITPDNASDGYHRALQAHREHQAEGLPTNPLLATAVARQDAVLAHPAYREPETAFTDAVAERERAAEIAPDRPADRAEAIHQAARDRAIAERAGDISPVPQRLFGAA